VHSPTLLIVTALLVGLMTLVLLVSSHINGRTPGMRLWTVGYVFGFLFCLNLLARPWLPEAVSVVLTQSCALLMAYWLLRAGHAYVGKPPPLVWPAVVGIPALAAVAVYFTVVTPHHGARYLIASWPAAVLFLLSSRAMVGGGWEVYPARYLYAVACAGHAVFLLVRPFWFGVGQTGLFDGHDALRLSQFVVLESLLAVLLIAFVVLMLANECVTTQLRWLAEQDPLTQVFNRRAFLTLLDKACSMSSRIGVPLPVLVIDVDHFKQINDTWGHQVGDQVLQHFVKVVSSVLRKEDVVGRLGGEEFAIFLPNSTAQNGGAVAERLRELVAEHAVPTAGATPVHFTISVGVALHVPEDAVEVTLHRADKAMYRAKRNGRNQVQVAD
jgi:diguanylate cyclase (GGDEF)-like protein